MFQSEMFVKNCCNWYFLFWPSLKHLQKWEKSAVYQDVKVVMTLSNQDQKRFHFSFFQLIPTWEISGKEVFIDQIGSQLRIPRYVLFISKRLTFKSIARICKLEERNLVQVRSFSEKNFYLMPCQAFFQSFLYPSLKRYVYTDGQRKPYRSPFNE